MSRVLPGVLEDFPDIEVNKVGFITNRAVAREAGVNSVPTLVCGDKKLSDSLLTKGKIRRFLEQL